MNRIPWAKPVTPRLERQMVAPSLDDMIAQDHEIRLFDALLRELDWAPWEGRYRRDYGQPPIHPRLVAGAILFGLTHGLHSSRQIEDATRHRLDLMWLLQGRTIDHTTIWKFRKKFEDLLPGLFDDLARTAAEGPQAGRRLAVDGTRIRANSDRHGSRTAASLKRRLAEVAEKREALLARMTQLDALEDLDDEPQTPGAGDEQTLRKEIEALDAKRRKLRQALERAQERDAVKQEKSGPKATATHVPVADPDAHLLPNKEGGYAPNYTPVIAVDVETGAIVDAQVPDGADEAGTLAQVVENTERRLGDKPEALLCDGNFVSGPGLKRLEEEDVALCAPSAKPVDPAVERPDLTQPVESDRLDDVPVTGKDKRFARQAFVYSESEDCYYCPQGRALRRAGKGEKRCDKNGEERLRWRYQRSDCPGCPLRSRCLKPNAKRRSVVRDEYQPYADRHAERMSEPQNQELYKKRAPVVEGAFGYIKHVMGFRRFLRRGAAAVRSEWQWLCTGFNVCKILRRRREERTTAPSGGPNGPHTAPERFKKACVGHFSAHSRLSAPFSRRLRAMFEIWPLEPAA